MLTIYILSYLFSKRPTYFSGWLWTSFLWIFFGRKSLFHFFVVVVSCNFLLEQLHSNVATQKLRGRVVVLKISRKLTCDIFFIMLEVVRLMLMKLGYTRKIYLISQFFKVTNKGKPPRMFSLTWNITKSDVKFLLIEISSIKVRANNVDFLTIKITSKKVYGNNMDVSTRGITSKKLRGENVDVLTSKIMSRNVHGNSVDFSISKITSKKDLEMMWIFVENWSSTYRHSINIK